MNKLKSMMFGSVAILRSPEDEGKSAAQLQRESIKVVSSNDGLADAEIKEPEEKKEEPKEEIKEDDVKEEVEEVKEEIETSEEKEEELKDELKDAKTDREREKIQKRIDREVAKRKVLEEENRKLKEQLAAKTTEDGDKLTKADAEALAERLATQKDAEREFDRACDRLTKAGIKIDPDFVKKVNEMAADIGQIPGRMIGILDDLDNGGAVLAHLADNPDEAEKIYALSSERMAMQLTKLSTKIDNASKSKPKPLSKVPPPNEPVKPNGGNSNVSLPQNFSSTRDMETFVKVRQRQEDEARKRKFE